MREAIITIIETETSDGVTYPTTKVYRVAFEGEFGIVGEVAENTDTFELRNVVASEKLSGEPTTPALPRH